MAKPLKKKQLNYRFHNPNSAEATAEYITHILVEVNRNKIENLLREAVPPKQEHEKTEDAAE